MTYKVVKFFTAAGTEPGSYEVTFSGNDRVFHKLEVRTEVDLGPDALDYIELFGIWFFIIAIELAGNSRTSKGLSLVVSRGAIKKLFRTDSSKAHLFNYANSIRTQLLGLEDITVEKDAAWTRAVEKTMCARWDGLPPPYPEVLNPIVGKVGITLHSVRRYYEHTNKEGRIDLIYTKVAKLLRDATTEVFLDARTAKHKELIYGDAVAGTRYLNTSAGWQLVIIRGQNGQTVLATIYQRPNGS
ncbi:hypothetical protein ACRCPS_18375 [Pseudomonas aeruginosa]